jgi:hypothetical protein
MTSDLPRHVSLSIVGGEGEEKRVTITMTITMTMAVPPRSYTPATSSSLLNLTTIDNRECF